MAILVAGGGILIESQVARLVLSSKTLRYTNVLSTPLHFRNNLSDLTGVSQGCIINSFYSVVNFETHAGFKSKELFSLDEAAKSSGISMQV